MDTHDREIFRRRVGFGELALDVAYVTSLLRRGELGPQGPERVEFASRLGHPVAMAIYPKAPFTEGQIQLLHKNWIGLDDRTLRLFSVARARRRLSIFEERFTNDHRPREAIEVAERFALGQASEDDLTKARAAAIAATHDGDAMRRLEDLQVVWETAYDVYAATSLIAEVAWAAAVDAAVEDVEGERLFLGDFLLGLAPGGYYGLSR